MAEQHWRVGTWNGHPNFECGHCSYATLHPRTLVEHLKTAHGVRLHTVPKPKAAKAAANEAAREKSTTADKE